MDIIVLSEEIFKYTSGYPFLVSKICRTIDEELNKDWTVDGIKRAIKMLLEEKNTLFEEIYINLENNKKLYNMVYNLVFEGSVFFYNLGNPEMNFEIYSHNNLNFLEKHGRLLFLSYIKPLING